MVTEDSRPHGSMTRRIYLDHAATAWPKCEAASMAAFEFLRDCGATAGRGAYTSSQVAERWLEDARVRLAQLIGTTSSTSIAICNSGTHALNLGLQGILRTGEHVLTTGIEHNSVLRPLQALIRSRQIEVSHSPSDSAGVVDVRAARELVRPNTRLICVGHASNVTGAVQDLGAWRALASACNARLLVDASQTLGYIPIDVDNQGIDILAAAGHKGLRALPGTGFLYVASELSAGLQPTMFGGTGRASESIDETPTWPSSFEVGNLNMLGVVSMAVAAESLMSDSSGFSSWQSPFERLRQGLSEIPNVKVIADFPLEDFPRVPLMSLIVDGWDVHDLAAILDTSFGIETRAGWHCAALVHAPIGSKEACGTLRLSTGHTTSLDEVDFTIAAFKEILG
jgi:cysteine desulfurase / selenocysteine lyase